jgi:hypothetical protein
MLGVDPVIDKQERVVIQSRSALKSAPSLRPGLAMMDGCLCKSPLAEAIRDSYAFRFPVTIVSHERFAAMAERNLVVFLG